MDLNKTVTLTNVKVENQTGIHFDSVKETSSDLSSNSINYDQSDIKNLSQLSHHYNLGEKFAEGGQGEILTGTDKLLKRFVAIKSLKKKFYSQPEVVNSFISEAIVTAQLDHPAIIPLYGVNKDSDDCLHLSMKLIIGKTFKELIEEDKANASNKKAETKALYRRLEFFASACDAINYAHEKKILHRDLKPENIMIGEHHDVYVMDWGIAKVFKDHEDTESTTSISGTPGYIAPEVLCHEPYGPAVDQYALGIILYEIITLKSPLSGVSLNARLMDTIDGKLPPFIHHFPKIHISPDLIAICKKSTSLEPSDRYESVKALAADIRLFISNQEVNARPDNSLRKIYRFIAAHRHVAAILILFILLSSAASSILSLKAQFELIKETRNRELKLLNLRSEIEQKSHRIDRHFLTLANLLARYTDRVISLKESSNKLLNPEQAQSVKDFHDFKMTNLNPLPGTISSPYYKQLINPNYLSIKTIDNKYDSSLNQLSPLKDYSLNLLAQSSDKTLVDQQLLKNEMLTNGFPISWLYVGFANGTLITYPANGAIEDDYDPRLRPWYELGKNSKGLTWSEPYEDIFGLGTVISAVQPIYATDNSFIGVAAFDLTLNYTKQIMNSGKINPALLGNFLLDKNGKLIISGKETAILDKIDKTVLNKYLTSGEQGRYEILLNNRKILIDFASIPTLNWFYLELIDIEKYLLINPQ